MPINLYVGLQGSGKTYEVVTVVILGALRDGRRIVTNISGLDYEAMKEILVKEGIQPDKIGTIFQVDHDKVLEDEFWRTDTDEKEGRATVIQAGDVVILDEIWRFWEGVRLSIPARQQNFFRMHRHMLHPTLGYCCEIGLITQDVGDVCSQIRRVVEKTFLMTKHVDLGFENRYRVDVYSRTKITSRTPPIESFQRTYNPEFFKLYKSHSVSDSKIQAKEKRLDKRGNLLNRKMLRYGVPIGLLVMLYGFYSTWNFFHAKAQPKPADVAKADQPKAPVFIDKDLNNQWTVKGWYYRDIGLVAVLQGQNGLLRYVVNPLNMKYEARDISFALPEGGRVSMYSGEVEQKKGIVK